MRPMLASAAAALPVGAGWTYEFKWDGVRVLLDVSGAGARLTSRLGNDVSGGYPELVSQFADAGDVLLDGEVVAFVDGRPSFERLQSRMHVRGASDVARAAAAAPVSYVLFDVLRHDGTDLTGSPLQQRREVLDALVAQHPGWTASPVFDDGAATESVARAQGLEGVVAKHRDSPYRAGVRSEEWRKLRFVRSGEFVVVGWEASTDHPATLSSLVLAVSGADGLAYAGKVGSGLAGRAAAAVHARLSERDTSPVAGPPPPRSPGRATHWVEPELVVEVQFTERTGVGSLRHPVFRGVRSDKTVREATGDG